ncbi:hypothetical protein [Pseudoalteromonas sp. OANN1]|uniref:hypothetical protein n=1 Tax=unclassified Pseudoalteromonas TaxID=194690 RepID=UPI0020971D9F|nr:hypothetical protein [Pseudoalteromonas sp. OANN1]MCO7201291.1 hypothetical protein [Pseudoalteromonas sp. OANN1]
MNVKKLFLASVSVISMNTLANVMTSELKPLELKAVDVATLKKVKDTAETAVLTKEARLKALPAAIAAPEKTVRVHHDIAYVKSASIRKVGYYKGDVLSDKQGNKRVVSGNLEIKYNGDLQSIANKFDLIILRDFENKIALVKPRSNNIELNKLALELSKLEQVAVAEVELLGSLERAF